MIKPKANLIYYDDHSTVWYCSESMQFNSFVYLLRIYPSYNISGLFSIMSGWWPVYPTGIRFKNAFKEFIRMFRIKTTILNSVTELIISENLIWSWIDESFNLFNSNFRCSCMSSAGSWGILEWLCRVSIDSSLELSLLWVTWGQKKSNEFCWWPISIDNEYILDLTTGDWFFIS